MSASGSANPGSAPPAPPPTGGGAFFYIRLFYARRQADARRPGYFTHPPAALRPPDIPLTTATPCTLGALEIAHPTLACGFCQTTPSTPAEEEGRGKRRSRGGR